VILMAVTAIVATGAAVVVMWPHPALGPAGSPEATGLQAGHVAPAFAIPGLAGGRLTLAQYDGHPRVVSFFAAWCESCWNDMAVLNGAYERYQSRGVVMIGIGVRDTVEDLRAMAGKLGISFPLGYDQGGDLAARSYRLYSVPTTVFIGTDGVIKAVVQGRVHNDTLQQYLAMILPAASQ
jgi:peroxiredoxin